MKPTIKHSYHTAHKLIVIYTLMVLSIKLYNVWQKKYTTEPPMI